MTALDDISGSDGAASWDTVTGRGAGPGSIAFRGATKRFGETVAVDRLNLEVGHGEFLVVVGPSGCGKTTALRMVAGLERPSEGRILLGGIDVTDVRGRDRDLAMVFQSYALYPHLTVADNIAFGLRQRGVERSVVASRVTDASRMLELDGVLDRRPAQLSGGQRQRVALARAVVRRTDVLLMDEPLSNLDAQLRHRARVELAELHVRLGTTILYVTHDQVEAMTMGHRIAVMRDGVLQQCATPHEVYTAPANTFVASFIGSPSMNLLEAGIDRSVTGQPTLVLGSLRRQLPPAVAGALPSGDRVLIGIRPEHFDPRPGPVGGSDQGTAIEGDVRVLEPLGSDLFVTVEVAGSQRLTARLRPDTRIATGDRVALRTELQGSHLFDPASGLRLLTITDEATR